MLFLYPFKFSIVYGGTKLPVKSTEKLGLRQDIVDYLKLLPKMEVGRRRKFEDIQLQTAKGLCMQTDLRRKSAC